MVFIVCGFLCLNTVVWVTSRGRLFKFYNKNFVNSSWVPHRPLGIMIFVSLSAFFLSFCFILFLNSFNLLVSLVVLELLSFVVIFSVSNSAALLAPSILVFVFCLFVLESVFGLVMFLNLLYFSGSDYVKMFVYQG